MIEIKNLSKKYSSSSNYALSNSTITINPGKIVGFIGPNGAGKTTVFNLLTKVYQQTKGAILLDGIDTSGMSTVQVNQLGIARTFQNIRLFKNMTVLDNVKASFHNEVQYSLLSSFLHLPSFSKSEKIMDEKALEILEVFELDVCSDELAANLPYGAQRKLEIARALATKPKLLLLDEPAAGMNPHETAELMDTIQLIRDRFHITILLIEHDMKLVSGICEQILVLNFGTKLANGAPEEVLNNPEVITAYLGK